MMQLKSNMQTLHTVIAGQPQSRKVLLVAVMYDDLLDS